MRMIGSRLIWAGVLIAPLITTGVTGCAFGQSSTQAPEKASASAEAALADFSPDERSRILAVQGVVERAAGERELDPSLINAIIWVESRFDVDAQSPAGARGLMQLMPSTAAYLAKRMGETRPRANDPEFNIRAGSLYLAEMIHKFGDETQAVAAYHAGPGNVAKWVAAGGKFPDWSNEYVAKVLAARERFRGLPAGTSNRVARAEPLAPAVAAPPSEPVDSVEPSDAPDPDTLPDAAELRRRAAAGQLDEPMLALEPEPVPIEVEDEAFELTFEAHPEADANPNAGPPPGWPTRRPAAPRPKPESKPKQVIAAKQPSPPPSTPDEQAPGLGVLPDL